VKTAASVLLAAWFVLTPATTAQAREIACWLDKGVVVVPAIVAGVPGDYVLDTGEAHTQLHETRAQGAGIAETALSAEIGVAGLRFSGRPVAVVDLDARTAGLPTPIAGVLGADVLAGLVLDVRFSPCRVGLYRPGSAPRFRAARVLPLGLTEGRLSTPARASDGKGLVDTDFVLATGSGHGLLIDESLVAGGVGPKPQARRRLRALSFAGDLQENVEAQVTAGGAPLVAMGTPSLSRYRLRFDLARGRLSIAQQKGPPDRADGP